MNPLAVFISSTCFDLKSLREHLRADISSWGYDPVLSEYPSFPVSPDLSTVENCKKVVRNKADVLVLIIGGKRGSLDPKTSQSVVNSEYREARAKGIDCIVFAEKSVWDLIPLYEKNPSGDFSPTVDSPGVFKFLEEVCRDTKWVFQFSRTEEILTILRSQLSFRFQDLLLRARTGRLLVPESFANEPERIARIAVDRGDRWEYFLACELLRERTDRLAMRFADLDSGFVVRRTRFVRGKDTISFIQDLLTDFMLIVQSAVKIITDQMTPAFGPQGVPGDAVKIKAACDNLYALFLALYEWELDVRFVRVHKAFECLFPQMSGWSGELLAEFQRIPHEFDRLLADTQLVGEHNIRLTILAPKSVPILMEIIQGMVNDPKVLMALRDD